MLLFLDDDPPVRWSAAHKLPGVAGRLVSEETAGCGLTESPQQAGYWSSAMTRDDPLPCRLFASCRVLRGCIGAARRATVTVLAVPVAPDEAVQGDHLGYVA